MNKTSSAASMLGRLGGKKTAENRTREEKSQAAKKAAMVRWGNVAKKKAEVGREAKP